MILSSIRPKLKFISFLTALILCQTVSIAFGNPDFPNPFAEMIHGEDTSRAEIALNKAIASVADRLQIPYIDEHGHPQTDGYFKELSRKAKAIDPHASIRLGGGTVRSIMGHIAEVVHTEKQRNPHRSTESILKEIAKSTEPLPNYEVLSVGSDLDVFYTGVTEEDHKKRISAELDGFMNSARTKHGLTSSADLYTETLMPKADVTDYEPQRTKSVAQGGSGADWLAFPMDETAGPRRVISPPEHPEVFHQLVKGEFPMYRPPDGSGFAPKISVRIFRTLGDLPYLEFKAADRPFYESSLDTLISESKNSGKRLPENATKQFRKLGRTSRGQANILYRTDDPIFVKGKELMMIATHQEEAKLPLTPEFSRKTIIESRVIHEDKMSQFLMSHEDFRQKYTHDGVLYHGTPSVDNLLQIKRSGFIKSSDTQGRAIHGSGTYSTLDRNIASKYGVPLHFTVNDHPNLRVIDLNQMPEDELHRLSQEASHLEMDLNRYLAEVHKVDIVVARNPAVNERYPIIQNGDAVKIPSNISEISRAYEHSTLQALQEWKSNSRHLQTPEKLGHMMDSFRVYRSYHGLTALQGSPESPMFDKISHDITKLYKQVLSDSSPQERLELIDNFKHRISTLYPDDLEILTQAVGDKDSSVSKSASTTLSKVIKEKGLAPESQSHIIEAMLNSENYRNYEDLINKLPVEEPANHMLLAEKLMQSDKRQVKNRAAWALGQMKPSPNVEVSEGIRLVMQDRLFKDFEIEPKAILDSMKKLNYPAPDGHSLVEHLTHAATLPEEITEPKEIRDWHREQIQFKARAAEIAGLVPLEKSEKIMVGEVLADIAKNKELNPNIRRDAIESLGKMNPESANVDHALIEALKDGNIAVKENALEAIGKISPTTPELVEAVENVKKNDSMIRLQKLAEKVHASISKPNYPTTQRTIASETIDIHSIATTDEPPTSDSDSDRLPSDSDRLSESSISERRDSTGSTNVESGHSMSSPGSPEEHHATTTAADSPKIEKEHRDAHQATSKSKEQLEHKLAIEATVGAEHFDPNKIKRQVDDLHVIKDMLNPLH